MVTEKEVVKFGEQCANIFAQVSRDVIGQKEVVEGTIIAMIAGGNVLLEGVPWSREDEACEESRAGIRPAVQEDSVYRLT